MHYHLEIYLPKETNIEKREDVENLIREYMEPYDEDNEELLENVQPGNLPTTIRPSEKKFIIGKDDSGKDIFSDVIISADISDDIIECCNPVGFWNVWDIGGKWDKYHGDNIIEISEFRKLKPDLAPRILLINPHEPFYSEEMFLYGKWNCDVLAKLNELEITDGYLVTVDCQI